MNRFAFGICAIGAAVVATPVLAADMALKAPPVPAATCTWCGWYVGLNAGYGWSQKSVLISPQPDPAFGLAPFTVSPDPKGFIGGAQIGFNQQSGRWVYGLEADFSGANISGSTTFFIPPPFGPGVQPVSEKLDWLATLRGRVGATLFPNFLIYGTGGLAVGHNSYSSNEVYLPAGPQYPSSGSSTNAGWTAGAGVEWALLGNWSAKLEYLYYDLGKHTITGASIPPSIFSVASRFDSTGNILRAGLNYKFGTQ